MAFGRIYFVPVRAKRADVSPVQADTPSVSTNLKRNAGKFEDCLSDGIQLEDVNLSLVAIWEDSPLRRQRRT